MLNSEVCCSVNKIENEEVYLFLLFINNCLNPWSGEMLQYEFLHDIHSFVIIHFFNLTIGETKLGGTKIFEEL